MNANAFLLLNLALSFYLVGAIWAQEVDIFRSWKLVDARDFATVQSVHWHKLPYWIFTPLALALMGSIALIWYHPVASPGWAIWGNLACQLASHALTAIYWGRWQAKLSKDERGPASPYLAKILATHWIRTLLINAYGLILLGWAVRALA
jgi:hypothetical protein